MWGSARRAEERRTLKRRDLKSRTPRVDLALKHTNECRVLPDRFALLEKLPAQAVVAEIGVAFGDYTAEIVKRSRPTQLYLIDAWDTPRFRDGLEQIRDRFAAEIAAGSVVVREGLSIEELKGIDGSLLQDHLPRARSL